MSDGSRSPVGGLGSHDLWGGSGSNLLGLGIDALSSFGVNGLSPTKPQISRPLPVIFDESVEQETHVHYIMYYQTEECMQLATTKFCADWGNKTCMFYHADYQRRRIPISDGRLQYYPEMCPNIGRGIPCPVGDACVWAHSKPEVYFHPAEYKTQECSHYHSARKCVSNAAACSFAHGETDLRQGMHRYRRVQELPAGRLDWEAFKTRPCSKNPCKATGCLDYHDDKDRRRNPLSATEPRQWVYTADLCDFVLHGDLDVPASLRCPQRDACNKAHNKFEELYHPDRYKLSFCRNRTGGCALGSILCAFAHDASELRRNLIDINEFKKNGQLVHMYLFLYKTEPCPYKNETHHYPHCIYYHNAVDFRRSPRMYGYGKELCPCRMTIDKCQLQLRCPYSHGHIEQMYHPAVYKTSWCDHRGTDRCRGKHCAFAHTPAERREAAKQETVDYSRPLPQDKMPDANMPMMPILPFPPTGPGNGHRSPVVPSSPTFGTPTSASSSTWSPAMSSPRSPFNGSGTPNQSQPPASLASPAESDDEPSFRPRLIVSGLRPASRSSHSSRSPRVLPQPLVLPPAADGDGSSALRSEWRPLSARSPTQLIRNDPTLLPPSRPSPLTIITDRRDSSPDLDQSGQDEIAQLLNQTMLRAISIESISDSSSGASGLLSVPSEGNVHMHIESPSHSLWMPSINAFDVGSPAWTASPIDWTAPLSSAAPVQLVVGDDIECLRLRCTSYDDVLLYFRDLLLRCHCQRAIVLVSDAERSCDSVLADILKWNSSSDFIKLGIVFEVFSDTSLPSTSLWSGEPSNENIVKVVLVPSRFHRRSIRVFGADLPGSIIIVQLGPTEVSIQELHYDLVRIDAGRTLVFVSIQGPNTNSASMLPATAVETVAPSMLLSPLSTLLQTNTTPLAPVAVFDIVEALRQMRAGRTGAVLVHVPSHSSTTQLSSTLIRNDQYEIALSSTYDLYKDELGPAVAGSIRVLIGSIKSPITRPCAVRILSADDTRVISSLTSILSLPEPIQAVYVRFMGLVANENRVYVAMEKPWLSLNSLVTGCNPPSMIVGEAHGQFPIWTTNAIAASPQSVPTTVNSPTTTSTEQLPKSCLWCRQTIDPTEPRSYLSSSSNKHLRCGHAYHRTCLEQALASNCNFRCLCEQLWTPPTELPTILACAICAHRQVQTRAIGVCRRCSSAAGRANHDQFAVCAASCFVQHEAEHPTHELNSILPVASPSRELITLLQELAQRLQLLHSHRLAYGSNLRPKAVLFRLPHESSLVSIVHSHTAYDSLGSICFQAPLAPANAGVSPNTQQDLEGFGRLLFFVLSQGCTYTTEGSTRPLVLIMMKSFLQHHPEQWHLITSLLTGPEALRPSIGQVLYHPFFWSDEVKLRFLCVLSTSWSSERRDRADWTRIRTALAQIDGRIRPARNALPSSILPFVDPHLNNVPATTLIDALARWSNPGAITNVTGSTTATNASPVPLANGSTHLYAISATTTATIAADSRVIFTKTCPALVILTAMLIKEVPSLAAEIRAHPEFTSIGRFFERGVFEDGWLTTMAHAPPETLSHIRGILRW